MVGASNRNDTEQEQEPTERTPLLAKTQEPGTGDTGHETHGVVEAVLDCNTPSLGHDQTRGSDTTKRTDFMIDISKTRFWLIFSGILLQFFVAMFDSTLMASAHPVITSYFNASNAASWLSTAFMLTTTSFNPLFGRVSDAIGRKPLYLFSLTMFVATTLWCALAQSMASFIIARAFCGFGAGGVMAMGAIMTNDLVRIEVRGTYQAYINLFYGLGSSCGAAFGGFLCEHIGWRWAFGIQVPPVLAILVCAIFITPNDLGPLLATKKNLPWRKIIREFDLPGSFFVSCSSAFLILGINLGGNILSWTNPFVIASLITSVVTSVILIWVESKAYRPILPLPMLFSPPRGNLVFSNFFYQIATFSVLFNAPLYFQAVKLDSPSVSGFRLAIPAFSIIIGGVSSGFFITWTGRMKAPQVLGAVCGLVGAIGLSIMWDDIPTWLATIFVIPPSMGQGIMFPATTLAVLATSKQEDQAVMTTTLALWRNLGTVLGVAVSSFIVQNALLAYLEEFMSGPDKAEVSCSKVISAVADMNQIIMRVRKSVEAIRDLKPKYQYEGTGDFPINCNRC